jgi:hypothetical protein
MSPTYKMLTRTSSISYQAKGRKEKKPKHEEQEGMPQHHHCPLAQHRGDMSPKYHEEQRKDVARTLTAHPPKNAEKEHK